MTTELPAGFLTLPADGDGSLASLLKKLSLLGLRELLTFPPAGAGQLAPKLQRFQQWLEATARGIDRKALVRALGHVDQRALTLALASGTAAPERVFGELVPALLAATVRESGRRGVQETLLWDVPLARLWDGARVIDFEPPAQGILADPTGLTLRSHDGTNVELDSGELALASATAQRPQTPLLGDTGPALCTLDSNPLSMLEEHPEKGGNAIDLGGKTRDEWRAALVEAFALIEATLPALHAEIVGSLQRIVPVGYEPEKHLSASYMEAPGLIYMTLHPSALTLAEAIIHETQHGKLNTLRWFDPVLENGDTTWSKSPVRPDLRPLRGVLLAVHAFVPVAGLHLRLLEQGHAIAQSPPFERRRREVLSANEDGLKTLRELGTPTEVGKRVMAGLEALHAATRSAGPRTLGDATVAALG